MPRFDIGPGIRDFLQETSMNAVFRNALAVAGLAIATQAAAQVTYYEREGFEGRSFTTEQRMGNFERYGLNDRVSSARIVSRNARIDDDRYAPAPVVAQVTFYERERFAGRSFTTERQVGNLRRFGFNDRASSG